MQSGLYVSLSSQMALEKRLTTIADNMANMNTTGFRATEVKFDELLSDTENKLNAKVAFVSQGNDYLSGRMPANCSRRETCWISRPRAMPGLRWTRQRASVLTKDGRFTMNDTGELVSIRGYPVLDAGGAPDPAEHCRWASPRSALTASSIRTASRSRRLACSRPISARASPATDNSGIMTTDTPRPVIDRFNVGVEQGYLENSNVNADARDHAADRSQPRLRKHRFADSRQRKLLQRGDPDTGRQPLSGRFDG